MDICIAYRNISYIPKGDSLSRVELPNTITVQARSGQGTYEPLAVHLNQQGIEASTIWYDHSFPEVDPNRWFNRMARPSPKANPVQPTNDFTLITALVTAAICATLVAAYVGIAYQAAHPTYVARIECVSPKVKISVSSKDKSVIDRLNPPDAAHCTIKRSKR